MGVLGEIRNVGRTQGGEQDGHGSKHSITENIGKTGNTERERLGLVEG